MAQYILEEEICTLNNVSVALSNLDRWIKLQQSTVDDHLSNIPEDREELQEFQAVVKSGLVQLEERDIHVIVTLISAQKHMEIADEKDTKNMKDDIPIVSDQVRKDWDKLKKDYEALQSTVEDMLNKYMWDDYKLQDLFQWTLNFDCLVLGSIEDNSTLVYEEQFYLLKSYEYQIEEKMKVLSSLKIAKSMTNEKYAILYFKTESSIEKLMKKIADRKEEVEKTIVQLEEFEMAVDKALVWVSDQESILYQIVVVDDLESIAPLIAHKSEVSELIVHVKDHGESIESVLKTGEDIGLKDIKRVSLYIKLVNLKTKWTQLDFGCHQKIIQIELNVLSIKEYALLQWLVEQEELLAENAGLPTRSELDEILFQYKQQKDSYEEIRMLNLNLKNKVDFLESEELGRDLKIMETHWINVYELLIAAFKAVAANEEVISSEEDEPNEDNFKVASDKGFDCDLDMDYDDGDMIPTKEVKEIHLPGMTIECDAQSSLKSAPPIEKCNGAPENSELKIEELEDIADLQISIDPVSQASVWEVCEVPTLQEEQYSHNPCTSDEEAEIDSTSFIATICDLRSWITTHSDELEEYDDPDVGTLLRWLTDLHQVLKNREVMIQDTHNSVKTALPKICLTASDELGTQMEEMSNDFNNLMNSVMARLQEARILKNEHDNVKDIMFDFEKKLIASEDTLAKIKSRIYKSEEIAANLTSLAELQGQLELWMNLFSKAIDSSRVPIMPSLQDKIEVLSLFYRGLFKTVKDSEIMLQTSQDFITLVQKDLKEIFEWVQTKQSEIGEAKIYTTIEDLELSLPVISQIAEDSHNKLLFFDPLKLTPIVDFEGVTVSNIEDLFTSSKATLMVLEHASCDLTITLKNSIALVKEVNTNCQGFLGWVKDVSTEVVDMDDTESKEEAMAVLVSIHDLLEAIPEREKEWGSILERGSELDIQCSSLISDPINTTSQEFDDLKELLMQKEVSVSDLIVQFAVHDRNNREITENLQDTERMLNSPLLIPCNTEGLYKIKERYTDMSKLLEDTLEKIEGRAGKHSEEALLLRDRCQDAICEQQSVAGKIDEALRSLLTLQQQLDDMIDWEKCTVKQLEELDPPTGDKSEVLELMEQIKGISKVIDEQEGSYNSLEDETNNLLIKFELGTGNEVGSKLADMKSLWVVLLEAAQKHKGDTEQFVLQIDAFDNAAVSHEKFLQSQQSVFDNSQQIPDIKSAKKRNDELLDAFTTNCLVEDMSGALEKILDSFPDVCLADEQQKLHSAKEDQDALAARMEDYSKALEGQISDSDNTPIDDLMTWAFDARESEMAVLGSNLPGSVEECEDELDVHEKIVQEMAAKHRDFLKAKEATEKSLQERSFDPSVRNLRDKMKELETLWIDTTEVIAKRHKSLEERLVIIGALSDDIEDLMDWIVTSKKKIEEAGEPPFDISLLIQQISKIKNVRSEVGEHGQDVTDVCSKGHEVLANSQKPDKMSGKLKDLTESWQELSDAARDRHVLLQQHLQMLQKEGESQTDALYNWLKVMSEELEPSTLPPNFESQDLLEINEQTQKIKKMINEKKEEAAKHLETMKTKSPLKGKTKNLEQILTHILKKLTDKEAYMKEHLGIMSQLEDLDELQEWLLQSSALVEEFNSIDPGDSEQIRDAVACYDQLKADLDIRVKDMDYLVELPRESVPSNKQGVLGSVLQHWDALSHDFNDKEVDMNELGTAISLFDDSLPYLISIKDDLVMKVNDISSENTNIDEVSMKLQQHKLISREITKLINSEPSRNLEKLLNSVNKILGNENVFAQEIATFRNQWDLFVDTVNDQRNSLTEEKMEWKQFSDSCSSKITWIKDRQEEVDDIIKECEDGSTDNLHQNMETVKVLSKSFAHYEEQIQQAVESTSKFTKSMKPQIDKLKEAWLRLGDRMEMANNLLDNSFNSDSFSQSLLALFQWLGEKEQLPVLSSVIPKDLELLDKDNESLKQLFSELEKHAEKVEELVEMDTQDTTLVQQVELLEQRWNKICDIAAAREEEMKDIRSQLEGYEAEFGRVSVWLDTQENRLVSMQGPVSSEAMLEKHLGDLDEFLKLESIAQTELLGLREAAKRLHGDSLPHKISSALNKNNQRWNQLCQQAKSTTVNLQQRLRLVLRHRSELDEVIKALNEQLADVETHLTFTEQVTDTKEVLMEKEKVVEQTISILGNVEEDYNTLQKLMLSCPIELHGTHSPHVTAIEEGYSKILMRHKIAVQSVNDQVNVVNKYGKRLDDTTGRIVSLLSELQDKIPFSACLFDITDSIEEVKTAVNKYKTYNAEVRSIQSDSVVVPFFRADLKNVKDRLDALDKFSKKMVDVLLKGSDISTEFNDKMFKIKGFLVEMSKEMDTSVTPFIGSENPQELQLALNTIPEIKHCMKTRAHLIEETEENLKRFDDHFDTDPLKNEYEEVCGSWFELLNDLEELQPKIETSLSSKTFFQSNIVNLKVTLKRHQDTLKTLEDVTTEEKLQTALDVLETLLLEDESVGEDMSRVILEGKTIIRNIDNVEDMKKIQVEMQTMQSSYRVIQNSVSVKHKKFDVIMAQLQEYKHIMQAHEVFIDSTQDFLDDMCDMLDDTVIEFNKTQLSALENAILDRRLEHDKVVNLSETVLRCLVDETELMETTSSVKLKWNKLNCSINEAGTAIEHSAKTLRNLYNNIHILKKETDDKWKITVDVEDISNDIANLRQQHRAMRMTLKEVEAFTPTVLRVQTTVEDHLDRCSESVRKDLTFRLKEFNDIWTTTQQLADKAFREIDARLGGVRRYHEQLSEEHAWYSSAEDRYSALKRGVPDLDSNQVTALADEVSEHFAALVELKDNIVKLKLEKVVIEECENLISSYEELQEKLDDLVKACEAESSKNTKLLSHIQQVQNQVYEKNRHLSSHQAVSSHHETAQYQAEQLDEFKGTLSPLECEVEELLRNTGTSSLPQEVEMKLTQLSDSWKELGHNMSLREQRIKQMLQLLNQFEESYNDLDSWLQDKDLILSNSLPQDEEGIRSHLDLLNSIQSILSSKYHIIQIVQEVGDALVTLSCSADVENIQTKLHKIKQCYAKLGNDLSLCLDRANEAAQGIATVKERSDLISAALDRYEEVVDSLPQFKGEVVDLTKLIESTLSQLDETYEEVEKLQKFVRALEDDIWSGENSYFKSIILDINSRFKRIRGKLKLSQDHILQSSMLAEQFLATIQNVITWIDETSEKVNCTLPSDQDQLIDFSSTFQALNREVSAKETSIDLLIEKGAMLLTEGNVDSSNCVLIEEQLSIVRDKYDDLKDLFKKREQDLESALNMCSRYQNKIDCVMGKLSRYDTLYLGADKPAFDLPQIREQIDRLEQSETELDEIGALIHEIEEMNMGNGADASFNRRKLQLRTKLDTVQAECESKVKTLLLYEGKMKAFEADMQLLDEWISESCEILSGDLDENAPSLETVKAIESDLSVQKDHLEAVRRNLDLFLREHKSAKQGHLPENLQRIEDNFQELEDLVRERREKGEDEQNEVAVFQEKMNDMYDWIHSKEQELAAQPKPTFVKEQADAQLQDHIKMQEDFGAMQDQMDAINMMGFDLFTKYEDRFPELKEQLATLNKLWERTCRNCVDRQRMLEEATNSLDDFWSNYNQFRDWLRESDKKLEAKPEPGATLQEQLDDVNALLDQLTSKRPQIDHLKMLSGKIPSTILAQINEQDTPLETELDETEEILNNQIDMLTSRKERLEEGCAAIRGYSTEVDELNAWLNEFEPKLKPFDTLDSADPQDMKNLQGKQKVNLKALGEKATLYNSLIEKGKDLLDKSQESEQQGVNAVLVKLTENWEKVEAAAEEMRVKLEDAFQHAKQFDRNYKDIMSWIQEAEAQITEPQSEMDLQSRVEKQQALVDGFKEYEPKFDNVFVLGEGLMSLCTPAAAAPISDKLDNLNEQWEELKRYCEAEQEKIKVMVDNMVAIQSKVDFYAEWMDEVTGYISEELDHELPQDLNKIRKLVDKFYKFVYSLEENSPFLNDLLKNWAVLEEEGCLGAELVANVHDLRDRWVDARQFLDDKFSDIRKLQLLLATKPAPKPAKEPKTDADRVDHEVQNVVASCICESKFKCEMVSGGKYKFGELDKQHLVRMMRTNIMIRVGGGWETLVNFLNLHDPCRVSSKGVVDTMLANLPKPGEALGLVSAALTTNRVVLGYTETTKMTTKMENCAGTVEAVETTQSDTDFAHAKGSQRFMERKQTNKMAAKTTVATPKRTTEKKMFTPNTTKAKVPSTTPNARSTKPSTAATSKPNLAPHKAMPLKKSRSYGVGDEVRVGAPGRRERTSSGSASDNKALSSRFATFSPAKGLQKSGSETDIESRRSGIPSPSKSSGAAPRSRSGSLSRSPSGDISSTLSKSRSGSIGRSPSGDMTPTKLSLPRNSSSRSSLRSTSNPKVIVSQDNDDDDETF